MGLEKGVGLKPREYQQRAVESVITAWERETKRVLVLMPTGTGKSLVISEIGKIITRMPENRLMILTHREVLAHQLESMLGVKDQDLIGIERGRQTAHDSLARTILASMQTMGRDNRLERYPPEQITHIIIDEAHHSLSKSYLKILDHFEKAYVLGVTATADRGDKRNLGEVFDEVVYEYTLRESIEDGWNCPIVAHTIPLDIDISEVGVRAGDFRDNELGEVIEPYLEEVADKLVSVGKDRKMIIFLPLISTSKLMNTIMRDKGFNSIHIDGNMINRHFFIDLFREDKYSVVCNSMLLIEGFDDPRTDCIVVLRPTKSRSLYAQMIGRGTRISEGKDFLLVPDFLWHSDRHDLCHPFSLLSRDELLEKKMLEAQYKVGRANIFEIEAEANKVHSKAKEKELARFLEHGRHRNPKLIDPVEYGLLVRGRGIQKYGEDYQEITEREKRPATESQTKFLVRNGINPSGLTSGFADEVIRGIVERTSGGLATPKQVKILKRFGYKDMFKISKQLASNRIQELSNNGWRR